uniref:Tick transposon n=1 Tax=Rhipicephalus appendiculatus TaxID=34631 RepID=A0A131YQA1_RHIAP
MPLEHGWYGLDVTCTMSRFLKKSLNSLLLNGGPLSLYSFCGSPRTENTCADQVFSALAVVWRSSRISKWWQRCTVEMSTMTPSTTPPSLTMLPGPSTLLPAPRRLDTSVDAWLGWRTWKSEFELFATATLLTRQPSDVQAATFLVSIGEDGRKAYSTFKFEAEEDKNEEDKKNLTLHEFRFGSRDQKEGEPFNEWLIELKILAKNCEFELLEERMLRSRIVLGVRDKRLQQKLLAENPSYQKTVEICRIEEQGKQHFQEICAAAGGAHTTIVNSVATDRKVCSMCGYQMRRSGNCPARGKNCRKCGAPNHFSQVCKSFGATRNVSRQGRELREVRAEIDFAEVDFSCGTYYQLGRSR